LEANKTIALGILTLKVVSAFKFSGLLKYATFRKFKDKGEIYMNIEQVILSGLTNGAIYALIAIGFVIIYNVTGIVNFAQGQSTMLGAMIVISLVSTGLNIIIAACITIAIVIAINIIMYRLVLYPLRNVQNILTTVMITMGLGIVISGIALLIWGTEARSLAPFSKGQPLSILRAAITLQDLWIIGACTAVILFIFYLFDKTYFGMAIRACMSNEKASRLMGIPIGRMAMFSLAYSRGF